MRGNKNHHGKPPMDLLDGEALQEIAKVLAHGAVKYAPQNWRQGMYPPALLAAALRHIFADLAGEEFDKESGELHLAHAGCELMFALWYRLHPDRVKEDDRFQKVGTSEQVPTKTLPVWHCWNCDEPLDPRHYIGKACTREKFCSISCFDQAEKFNTGF